MSFVDVLNLYEWDDIRLSVYGKTKRDVQNALAKTRLTLEDFKALISPAAESYLEVMAQKAQQLTRKRFGNTISMYIPLYLSNLCANDCTYCGFSMSNKIKRKILDENEIDAEVNAIKSMKFDSVLLVTGEHETKAGMNYFRKMIPRIKQQFNYVAMEVQPLDQEEYAELKTMGLDAVMVYQETYNRATYSQHHLRGNKMDFEYRLMTPDRLGKAGIDKIGIGALIGLEDWRTDCFLTAAHLDYLEKTYWRSRYSISFPRLRPCTGGLEPKSIMTDAQLLQLICAYRLFNPEVELSLSTRESAKFRDSVVPIAITSLSAASKTQPGGYANAEVELEQFSINDDRSVVDVTDSMHSKGLQTVWKDWDKSYLG
ncbi:2-iminoacetate synthase ThiH [Vibrio sp.]|nr:2-iminoacetate synthase ThiH [Vibrio sp.]